MLLSLRCRDQGKLLGGSEVGFEELVAFDLEKADQWDKSGERIHRDKSLEAVTWWVPVENQAQSGWWVCVRWFTRDKVEQTVGGHGCWAKGCVLHFVLDVGHPWKGF